MNVSPSNIFETLTSTGGTLVIGIIVFLLYDFLRRYRPNQERVAGISAREETSEEKVRRLTASLQEAAQAIGDIQKEIQERHRLASKLQQDVQTYQRLKQVNAEEVEAVVQALGGEVRKEGRRNLRTNIAFFVLGVIASAVTSLLFG